MTDTDLLMKANAGAQAALDALPADFVDNLGDMTRHQLFDALTDVIVIYMTPDQPAEPIELVGEAAPGYNIVIDRDIVDAKIGEKASDFVGRFATVDIASSFLSLSASIDPDDLKAGRYGICEMAVGEFCEDEPVLFTETGEETSQPGIVIRERPEHENPEGTGILYEVTLDDGTEVHAFPNELAPVPTELPDGIDG